MCVREDLYVIPIMLMFLKPLPYYSDNVHNSVPTKRSGICSIICRTVMNKYMSRLHILRLHFERSNTCIHKCTWLAVCCGAVCTVCSLDLFLPVHPQNVCRL